MFRHTMATLMHENGADVRHVQSQLGHSDMATTAIYTHVSVHKLKQIHRETHPAEMPKRPCRAQQNFEGVVRNGRLQLDAPTELPEGRVVRLQTAPI